ncbi:MAG: DUF3592 domain-containing protein [Alcaligenaceae bacterium]|nr:DUF3592 domain-containing protein [Alcaligenaceae bacterium]
MYRYRYQGQIFQNNSGSARPVKYYDVGSLLQAYVPRDNPQDSRLIADASESSVKSARRIMTGVMIFCTLMFLAALIGSLLVA